MNFCKLLSLIKSILPLLLWVHKAEISHWKLKNQINLIILHYVPWSWHMAVPTKKGIFLPDFICVFAFCSLKQWNLDHVQKRKERYFTIRVITVSKWRRGNCPRVAYSLVRKIFRKKCIIWDKAPEDEMSDSAGNKNFLQWWTRRKVRGGNEASTYRGRVFIYVRMIYGMKYSLSCDWWKQEWEDLFMLPMREWARTGKEWWDTVSPPWWLTTWGGWVQPAVSM